MTGLMIVLMGSLRLLWLALGWAKKHWRPIVLAVAVIVIVLIVGR